MAKKLVVSFFLLFLLLNRSPDALAQDIGVPVFKKLTLYSMAGGLGGGLLGTLWWATDPLNPNISVRENLMLGFALGTFVGFFIGVNQIINDRVPTTLDSSLENVYGLEERTRHDPALLVSLHERKIAPITETDSAPSSQNEMATPIFRATF